LHSFQEREKKIREASCTLLFEGSFIKEENQIRSRVFLKVYNLIAVIKQVCLEKKDVTVTQTVSGASSSESIVHVEDFIFLPALRLILNDQQKDRPFIMSKYSGRKFELHFDNDIKELVDLWTVLHRRAILYVSPSKVPSEKTSHKIEASRKDPQQIIYLGGLVLGILTSNTLKRMLPKVEFLYETASLAGVVYRVLDPKRQVKELLLRQKMDLLKIIRFCANMLARMLSKGYLLRQFSYDHAYLSDGSEDSIQYQDLRQVVALEGIRHDDKELRMIVNNFISASIAFFKISESRNESTMRLSSEEQLKFLSHEQEFAKKSDNYFFVDLIESIDQLFESDIPSHKKSLFSFTKHNSGKY